MNYARYRQSLKNHHGDRNNENWGIIRHIDGSKELAPVYDNGNCFNNKWTDEKMQAILDDQELEALTISAKCYVQNGRLEPFVYRQLMQKYQ